MRLQGKPKTPDVLLMVPLAVRLPRSPRRHAAALAMCQPTTRISVDDNTDMNSDIASTLEAAAVNTVVDSNTGGITNPVDPAGSVSEKGTVLSAGDVKVVHWIDSKGGQTE